MYIRRILLSGICGLKKFFLTQALRVAGCRSSVQNKRRGMAQDILLPKVLIIGDVTVQTGIPKVIVLTFYVILMF